MDSRASIIADLRAHIDRVAPMRAPSEVAPTGIPALDAHLGGWPQPGIVLVHGPVGSGRFRVVLPTLQKHTSAEQTVAVVDPIGWLHPPGLPGVNLQHLMLIRCGNPQADWATAQIAASGAVPIVILLDPPPMSRRAARLIRASEVGQSTVIVIGERLEPHLTPQVRLRCLGNNTVQIERGSPNQPTIKIG